MRKESRLVLQYFLIRILVLTLQWPPRKFALFLAKLLGGMAYYLMKEEREKVIAHLSLAFGGEMDSLKIRKMARQTFLELGMNAVDFIHFPKINSRNLDRLVKIKGLENFEAAYRKGKGVIGVTGHLGNWELIPLYFSLKGYSVNVIGRRLFDSRLDRMLVNWREKKGIKNLDRDRAGKKALRALFRGEALGVLIDQDTSVDGVFVNFFGHPAYTPIAPVAMALKTGAEIVPLAIHREANGLHIITVKKPLQLILTGDKMEDLRYNVARCTEIIEEFIRQHPSQWVWMHERWKRKPG